MSKNTKPKKRWTLKKKITVLAIVMLIVLYVVAQIYFMSDSYIDDLGEGEGIVIEDTTGETIYEPVPTQENLLLLSERITFYVPILLFVSGLSWLIIKLTNLKNNKQSKKTILHPRSQNAILMSGFLGPLVFLYLIWDSLFPPQCGDNGTVLGGPENCIIGASFGGIVALPLMIVSASFLVAMIYKIFLHIRLKR